MKSFATAIGAIALVAMAAMAEAAPTVMHVTETMALAATPDKVWSVLHEFSDMSWVPPVKGTTATKGNTVGSVRTIDLGGPKLVERLDRYSDQERMYAYTITDDAANKKTLPVSDYHSVIHVAPNPSGGSIVTWTGSFSRADTSDSPAEGMDEKAAQTAVTGVYQAGFSGLKQRVGG